MGAPSGNHNHKKHGLSHTRIDNIYKNMMSRCYNPKNNRYKNYGARGIKVCKEWIEDRTKFYEWANQSGYEKGLSIDRIDTNGNYSPNNCRWATNVEQANNRTSNRIITAFGKSLTMMEWSRITGIKAATIHARLKRGWSEERAVSL